MTSKPPRPTSQWLEQTLDLFEGTTALWREAATDRGAKREVLAALSQEVTQLFREAGVPEDNLAPLQYLAVALYDLSRGARNPLLVINENRRAPGGWETDRRRVFGAALVRWLEPMKIKDAYALVAKEFRQAGHQGYNGKALTAATVRKWCEIVRQGGERKVEERLAQTKVDDWRAKEAGLQQPLDRALFVRHVAVGLMNTR